MHSLRNWFIGLLAAGFAASSFATSPSVSLLRPKGGQRGKEHEITISGIRLKDAAELHFYRPGIKMNAITPAEDGKSVKVKIQIAPDCELGRHPLRLRTASGISELFTYHVGAFPDLEEKEPNNSFEELQPITMNTTVNGIINNEDVDYYVVEAKKGQRLSAEIEGVRLGLMLLDPYVAILNTNRFELSASDDTALLLQDSLASIDVPADGKYIIQVRETSYGGDGNRGLYRLHVGDFERPRVVYPLGGKPKEKIKATFIGDVKGTFTREVALPEKTGNWAYYPGTAEKPAPSPNWLRVSNLDNVMETEPNDSRGKPMETGKDLPVAMNGILEKENDQDWFKFTAKKGQSYHVETYARRLRSPVDPIMDIYDPAGKRVTGNDDSRGPDSYVNFKVPADGEYTVRIRDHLRKGGPDYAYRIEFEPVKPVLTFNMPVFRRNTQDRQHVAVPKGNRYGTIIDAKRNDFGGDLKILFENLPPGVTYEAPVMPANMTQVPVIFTAAPDAAVSGLLGHVKGEHVDPAKNIKGGIFQDVPLVYGPPNNTVFLKTDVDKIPIAVTEEVPFAVRLVQPTVPLVHGGYTSLKVEVDKKEGFDEAIKVYMLYKPPGISANSQMSIGKGKNGSSYRISANGSAGDRIWKLAVIASSTVNGGLVWVASNYIDVQVTTPYISGAIDMAALELGKEGEVVCKINQHKPFEGEAKISLVGLPAKVTTEGKTVTKDTKEVVFNVKIDPASPKGQHKSLFCSLEIPQNNTVIQSSIAGGGVLRIDPPPPPPKNPAPKPVVVEVKKEPAKKPEKRLTRLEKLRLLQKERMQGSGG